VLVALNVVGIQEAAKLNIMLAVLDFATQLLLVAIGFVLIFHPHTLASNIHFGTAPTWSSFALAIPVAMIAYTGIETVSNLAEETRDPLRAIPKAISWVAVAVFAIYFTLPWIALSAMPVVKEGGKYVTPLGQSPPHGFKNDPVLGLVENLGLHGPLLQGAKVYVGILAATILFIATNAGVIGASRITYSMASYRQLPEVFRRLHPKLKTPWLSLVVFAGIAPTLFLLSGKVDFLGRMYAFGAMLSFTIAHVAVVALRAKKPEGDEQPWRARPSFRFRGVDWPLFAVIGGLGTGAAWLVVVIQDAPTRYAGLGWLLAGFGFYVFYRHKLGAPLRTTVRAPIVIVAGSLEYRSILVPIAPGYPSDEAMQVACRLADERRASIVAETVIEVPLELPLDAYLPEQVEEANAQLDEASAIAELYGVRVTERIVRARNAGRAIVDEATRRGSEIIVMGGPRRVRLSTGKRAIFGDTVDFVLKHAPCRVMVAAAKDTAK
jgi:APA family basic amino acid/polyamine antiporter